jgi:hypothetical protein
MFQEVANKHNDQHYLAGIMPPWLWFWLIVYLFYLPGLASYLWEGNLKPVFIPEGVPDFLGSKFFSSQFIALLLAMPGLHEIIPSLLVLLGVLTIFLPHLRKLYLEKHYKLRQPSSVPPGLEEIIDFIHQYAPKLEIRTNLIRTKQVAFVYPLGYRKAAVGLFGGIMKLWRSDREAAEAILLHEISHYRHGDVLIVGAGSFFETLLKIWFPLLILLFFIPSFLIYGHSVINSFQEIQRIHQEYGQFSGDENWFFDWLKFQVGMFFSTELPGTLSILIMLFLISGVILIAPLLGIWCSEFNADQFVINIQKSPHGLLRALSNLSPSTSWWYRILFGMSHPPVSMRQWFASHSRSKNQFLFLLFLFPFAYIIKLILLHLRAIAALASISSRRDLFQQFIDNTIVYFQTSAPVWLAMGIFLLVYPRVAKFWEQSFCGDSKSVNPPRCREYFICALAVGCCALLGYLF